MMPVVSILEPDDRQPQTGDLTRGSVGRVLLHLTWPMLIGHFAVVAGAWLLGPEGIFATIAMANVLAGGVAVLWVRRLQRGPARASAAAHLPAAA